MEVGKGMKGLAVGTFCGRGLAGFLDLGSRVR